MFLTKISINLDKFLQREHHERAFSSLGEEMNRKTEKTVGGNHPFDVVYRVNMPNGTQSALRGGFETVLNLLKSDKTDPDLIDRSSIVIPGYD